MVDIILVAFLVISCAALVGLILIQRGKGGGLVAFGSGGAEQAFGTHAATVAQKATAALGALVLILTLVLSQRMAPSPESRIPTGPSDRQPPAPTEPAPGL